jgi:XRE family aerobic/anaerobic benzoate catabolism transcriptional regulator
MASGGPRNADLQSLARVLGERLRRLRAQRGLTQRAAAARIGIGPLVLRRLERGSANPSLAILVSVARAFGIPLCRLLKKKP